MGHCFGYNDGINSVDELSPVSALRLRFDSLPAETTDIMPESKTVFGLPVPAKFVPQRLVSWISQDNDADNDDTSSDEQNATNSIATKKVCAQVCHYTWSLVTTKLKKQNIIENGKGEKGFDAQTAQLNRNWLGGCDVRCEKEKTRIIFAYSQNVFDENSVIVLMF